MKIIFKHKLLSLLFVILLAGEVILNVYANFNFGEIINERNSDIQQFLIVVIRVVFTFLSALFFTFVFKTFTDFYFAKILKYYRFNFAKAISLFSYPKFANKTEGSYIGDFANNSKIVLQKNIISKFNILQGLILLSVSLVFIGLINPYLALWSFLLSSIMLILPLIINKKYSKSNQNLISINNQYTGVLSTIFKSFKTLILFNENQQIETKLNNISEKQIKIELKNKLIINLFNFINGSLALLIQILIITLAIYYYTRGQAQLGGIISASILFQSMLGGMTKFVFSISESISSKKISTDLWKKYEAISWEKNIDIVFDKVSVQNYQFKANNKTILEIPNFEIKNNEKIAIIAKSGSGKTTFVESLININNNYEGSIFFDKLNFKNEHQNNIVNSIKYVEQNPYIFNDTLLYNITLGHYLDIVKFDNLINLLDLKEFIDSKAEKENFDITENGANLSGGQKQKIALARALYSESPFLILDEATSQIDSKTAKLIDKKIMQLNKTVIMISHHLDASDYNFDNVYTI